MNILKILIMSFRKSKKLKQIYKALYIVPYNNTQELLNSVHKENDDSDAKEIALNNLINLIRTDITLIPVLEEYSITDAQLKEIYFRLCALGHNSYQRGHLVAAAAIAYFPSLNYILKNLDDFNGDKTLKIADNIYMYYVTNSSEYLT